MKMKRMIASVLALLLMVSLLPIGVMAEDVEDNPAGSTTDISESQTMNWNRGEVGKNEGVINNNGGSVIDNANIIDRNVSGGSTGTVGQKDETGKVVAGTGNNGTIRVNDGGAIYMNNETGIVEDNYRGTIETNNGTVETNSQGTIETNNGKVLETGLGSTVETNAKDGKIGTNNGTVGKKDKDGNAVPGTGNNGTIETNNGTVITNNETGTVETNKMFVGLNTGTVETNAKGGEIETNNGTVGKKDENGKAVAGTGNSGTIETNNGTVITNNKGGKIENNYGTVETNNQYVDQNTGTVETNNGYVGLNNGTVETNNWVMLQNNGTVETNNQYVEQNTGTVETNKSSVHLNNGTIETNKEMVDRNNGTVVTNAIDGFVGNGFNKESAEYGLKDSEENEASPEKGGVVEKNFGTVYDYTKPDGEDGLTIYYGLSWGENTDHLNLIDGAVKAETEKNLDEIASSVTRDGYRRTGYTAYYREGGKDIKIEETNRYTMNAPTWLKILWEKIVTAVESHEPEAKPEKKTSIPTSLSADQVKVGAYVRQGNLLFRIIEVGDDYIRVATVPKLSEQALADMLGFLKQHLSDAQIAKINGEPKLLEQELVTYFFGGTFEHISFYAAPDLFA